MHYDIYIYKIFLTHILYHSFTPVIQHLKSKMIFIKFSKITVFKRLFLCDTEFGMKRATPS